MNCCRAIGYLWLAAAPILCAAMGLSGCISENTGSTTVVGAQTALPEISDASGSLTIRVYETIKGARVWTAKDSKVTVEYTNAYTNNYLGVVETQDQTSLKVKVEPLDLGRGGEEAK